MFLSVSLKIINGLSNLDINLAIRFEFQLEVYDGQMVMECRELSSVLNEKTSIVFYLTGKNSEKKKHGSFLPR